MSVAGAAVIVDTNVVVGGFPRQGNPRAAAAILERMLAGELAFVLSPALLAEYGEVLQRPNVARLHGLAEDQLAALLERLAGHAAPREPAPAVTAPDPGDQMLWELLAGDVALRLVTIDKALLRDRAMRGRVLTPEAFLASDRCSPS